MYVADLLGKKVGAGDKVQVGLGKSRYVAIVVEVNDDESLVVENRRTRQKKTLGRRDVLLLDGSEPDLSVPEMPPSD